MGNVKYVHYGLVTMLAKERPIDKLIRLLDKAGIIQPKERVDVHYDLDDSYWGSFVSIKGPKWLVRFLEWASDYRGPDAVDAEVDVSKNGNFIFQDKEES